MEPNHKCTKCKEDYFLLYAGDGKTKATCINCGESITLAELEQPPMDQ